MSRSRFCACMVLSILFTIVLYQSGVAKATKHPMKITVVGYGPKKGQAVKLVERLLRRQFKKSCEIVSGEDFKNAVSELKKQRYSREHMMRIIARKIGADIIAFAGIRTVRRRRRRPRKALTLTIVSGVTGKQEIKGSFVFHRNRMPLRERRRMYRTLFSIFQRAKKLDVMKQKETDKSDSGYGGTEDTMTSRSLNSNSAGQDGEDPVSDRYSKKIEKNLMLVGVIQNSLPNEIFKKMLSLGGFERFDLSIPASKPNDSRVVMWCKKVARISQELEGDSEALTTLARLLRRCSDVYRYNIKTNHRCIQKTSKKSRYVECSIGVKIVFEKFEAVKSGKAVVYKVDKKFGSEGKKSLKTSARSTAEINQDQPYRTAMKKALDSAAFLVGFKIKRKVRDIKEFQIHAPIVKVDKRNVFTCLGRDMVELDMPFYVIKPTSSGGKRVGFVKARKIYDGCGGSETEIREKKKKQKEIVLKPMASEIILGRNKIKKGMTISEMPSIGLNIGAFFGMTGTIGFFKGNVGLGGGFAAEFNLAPYIGISELYAIFDFAMLAAVDPDELRGVFLKRFDTLSEQYFKDTSALFGAQFNLGSLKRWFLAGPLFAEFSLSLSVSTYDLGLDSDRFSASLVGVGVAARGGIGFQLAPRWMIKFNLGYRLLGMKGVISEKCESDDCPSVSGWVDPEHGVICRFVGLYTW